MANFKEAWSITSVNEGGYANVVGDHGGETYRGITRPNFPHWKGWPIVDAHKPLHHGAMINDVALEKMVEDFYVDNFWKPIHGDTMTDQDLANQVFDMAVNAGVGEALKLLRS